MIEFFRFSLADLLIVYLLGYIFCLGVFYGYNDNKLGDNHFLPALKSWFLLFAIFFAIYKHKKKKDESTDTE